LIIDQIMDITITIVKMTTNMTTVTITIMGITIMIIAMTIIVMMMSVLYYQSRKDAVLQLGCEWDGTLRNIVTEPIFTQKVYDAALSNLQALSTLNNVKFYPELPRGCRVIKII